ncbi:MAG TPA: glycosyl hydrolase family 28-related protein [Candidatus Binatia bacterium]|nr:glycosyl hydrolase family 28-related protein [Candidatus Binatia bacterium]
MGDLPASGPYPGTTYTPQSPEQNGVYHEDREVSLLAGGGSKMYRTYNAKFEPGSQNWAPDQSSLSAYATVQDSEGSIHHYKLNSSGSWDGSHNNTVYNGVDFGMSANNTGTQNHDALLEAVIAAVTNGGIVFIPAGTYQITGTITVDLSLNPGSDQGVVIMGVGGGTELIQQTTEDTFSLTELTSGKGVRFKDLSFKYLQFTSVPSPAPAAIRIPRDCIGVTCERVFFQDCPQALYLGNRANHCGLIDCFINYDNLANQVMVYITGSDDFIHNCIFIQPSQSTVGTDPPDGPPGCTAIVIASASVVYITDTHITDFTTGINIQGGGSNPLDAYFSNVMCNCWSRGVMIQPVNSAAEIFQVFFSDCVFVRETDSTDSASIGVYIDSNLGPSANVSDLFFDNCMCYSWNAAGIQINAGQNIVITGGRYGSNASSLSTSGGIAITGTTSVMPANVTITGADFTAQLTAPTFPVQPHAISITAGVAGLYVRGCNLTDYTTTSPPIYTSSSAGTQIEITDCAGYNDKGTMLQHAIPPPGTITNTSAWNNAPQGWFGPIAFYVTGAGDVSVGNATTQYDTHLSDGAYELSPGEVAVLQNPSGATHFLAIGK